MWLDHTKTGLYRLFDASGSLLYVGISNKPDVRIHQHELDKPWWPEVASHTVEWFPDRITALDAETSAIRAERPRHNKLRHPDRQTRAAIPDDGVTLTEFRQRIVGITDRVEATGEVVFLYSHGKKVAALMPAAAAMELERLAGTLGGLDRATEILLAAAAKRG